MHLLIIFGNIINLRLHMIHVNRVLRGIHRLKGVIVVPNCVFTDNCSLWLCDDDSLFRCSLSLHLLFHLHLLLWGPLCLYLLLLIVLAAIMLLILLLYADLIRWWVLHLALFLDFHFIMDLCLVFYWYLRCFKSRLLIIRIDTHHRLWLHCI
jgi:hypothetical protein